MSERVSWEWRRVSRSFKQKKHKEHIKQLQAWNIALRQCGLERREASLSTEHRGVEAVRNTFDGERTRRTRENAHALHNAIGGNLGCTCPDGHRGSIRLNWHSDKPAAESFRLALSRIDIGPAAPSFTDMAWKMISAGVEDVIAPCTASSIPTTQSGHGPRVQQFSNPQPVPNVSSSTTRSQGKNKSVSFGFSELFKKKDSRIPAAAVITTGSPSVTQASVSAHPTTVCSMLRLKHNDGAVIGTMAVPNSDPCKQVRILADEDPLPVAPMITRVIQLDAALSHVIDPVTNRQLGLYRKQRYSIAAGLAWAVLHLCESPWLDTALGDGDIHLFMRHESGSPRLSDHPYLSHGFGPSISPPASQVPTASQSTIQPPQSNQIRNMTLYTLAIRLIELGLGKPFATLRNEHNVSEVLTQSLQSSSASDDFVVAQHLLFFLDFESSPSYANAVQHCLGLSCFEVTQRHTFENGAFRKTFFENVVAPVQANFDLIPGSAAQLF
jgi:hypothetical protein